MTAPDIRPDVVVADGVQVARERPTDWGVEDERVFVELVTDLLHVHH